MAVVVATGTSIELVANFCRIARSGNTPRNFFADEWFKWMMKSQLRSAFTLIEIMVVVAIIGMLAAVAIPNLSEAIKNARQKACAINRKNIDAAKHRWALETQQPEDATPTDADLFGAKRYIEHKPDCPARGKYSLNAVAEKCACSVVDHVNLAVQ